MKKNIFFLFVFIPLIISAQALQKSDVTGSYIVRDGLITTKELPAEVKHMMNTMINGFIESQWTFDPNGTFRIEFIRYLDPLMQEMKFLDNKLWVINSHINEVRIGTKEDNYNHLVFTVKKSDTGMNIYFSDTPIFLGLNKLIPAR